MISCCTNRHTLLATQQVLTMAEVRSIVGDSFSRINKFIDLCVCCLLSYRPYQAQVFTCLVLSHTVAILCVDDNDVGDLNILIPGICILLSHSVGNAVHL